MRTIILQIVVLSISFIALFRPKIGLCGYLWYSLMRPDALAYTVANYFSLVLALSTLAGSLRYLGNAGRFAKSSLVLCFFVFQLFLGLSVVAAVDPRLCTSYSMFLRLSLMALLIVLLTESLQDAKIYFLVMTGSMGLLGSKFGLFGLLHGGVRFAQGYGGGFLSDNNTLGSALLPSPICNVPLAMTVPLCWYCRTMARSKGLSNFWTAITLLDISAVVMTYSRGAALATGAAFLTIAFRSGKKMLAQLVLLGCLTAPAVYLVWDSYVNRIESISNPGHRQRTNLLLEGRT